MTSCEDQGSNPIMVVPESIHSACLTFHVAMCLLPLAIRI